MPSPPQPPLNQIPNPQYGHLSFPLIVPEKFYTTATFWKRFSVLASIALSIASLIISAYANLRHENAQVIRSLTVSGIVVNSLSISIAALTSLDWKSKSTNERLFAEQLLRISHVHEGDRIVVLRKGARKGEEGSDDLEGVVGRGGSSGKAKGLGGESSELS
ncbi:hypothetical protein BGZ60DRAFT_405965 [Tricladium varicosporioides]|nr:hypothetical protein BGZ60DRAFT_405965 [Hymenoscyphus varicosporioides]